MSHIKLLFPSYFFKISLCLYLLILISGCGNSHESQIEALGANSRESKEAKFNLMMAQEDVLEPLFKAGANLGNSVSKRRDIHEVLLKRLNRSKKKDIKKYFYSVQTKDADESVIPVVQFVGMEGGGESLKWITPLLASRHESIVKESLISLSLMGLGPKVSSRRVKRFDAELIENLYETLLKCKDSSESSLTWNFKKISSSLAKYYLDKVPDNQVAKKMSLFRKYLKDNKDSIIISSLYVHFLKDQREILEMDYLEAAKQRDILIEAPRLKDIQANSAEELKKLSFDQAVTFNIRGTDNLFLPPKYKTEVKVFHNSEDIFFKIRCEEPFPKKMSVVQSKRDHTDIWKDECIELYFHPEGEGTYFQVNINAKGAVFDQSIKILEGRKRSYNHKWNIEMNSVTEVNEKGKYWTMICSLKIKDLLIEGEKKPWGFNVVRNKNGKNSEYTMWMDLNGRNHNTQYFGFLKLGE